MSGEARTNAYFNLICGHFQISSQPPPNTSATIIAEMSCARREILFRNFMTRPGPTLPFVPQCLRAFFYFVFIKAIPLAPVSGLAYGITFQPKNSGSRPEATVCPISVPITPPMTTSEK